MFIQLSEQNDLVESIVNAGIEMIIYPEVALEDMADHWMDVEIVSGLKSDEGVCADMMGDDEESELRVDPSLPLEELVVSIMHELIHLRQILNGRLVQGAPASWDGVAFDGVDYADLPWEQEAYNLEQSYADMYLKG